MIKKFVFLFLPHRQDNYIYLVTQIIIIELLILGLDFFQHSGHIMMPISCNASYIKEEYCERWYLLEAYFLVCFLKLLAKLRYGEKRC